MCDYFLKLVCKNVTEVWFSFARKKSLLDPVANTMVTTQQQHSVFGTPGAPMTDDRTQLSAPEPATTPAERVQSCDGLPTTHGSAATSRGCDVALPLELVPTTRPVTGASTPPSSGGGWHAAMPTEAMAVGPNAEVWLISRQWCKYWPRLPCSIANAIVPLGLNLGCCGRR